MSEVKSTIFKTGGKLIGIALALAVVGIVTTLSAVSTASAGLVSAMTQIATFLVLIGLGIAVGLMSDAFGGK